MKTMERTMDEKTWNNVDDMLINIVRHVENCSSPDIRSEFIGERMQFGFMCACCGQRWMLRLMQFGSYCGELRPLFRNSEGRESIAAVLNSKGSMNDLRTLAGVRDVMEE